LLHRELWALGQTPVNNDLLKFHLEGYDNQSDAKYLLDGFTFGFKLQYSGPRLPINSKNLKSVSYYPEVLRDKLLKEKQLGRILGPFNKKPLPNLRINPVGLVPKKSGGWRLISNLSHPNGFSVNDFIDPDVCSVQYSKFDNAIEIIQSLGISSLIAKKDVKSAFNLCPVYPGDFDLLGIFFDDTYWIQKMLPQGASISCAIFEKFATFIQFCVSKKANSNNIDHFLDDFFFAAKNRNQCQILLDAFDSICYDMGIPVNDEKTEGPTTKMEYLGLEIDTAEGTIKVPSDKIEKAKSMLEEALCSKKITLKKLQSMVGLLNFFSKAIPSGRAFNCRFYAAMSQVKKPYHLVRLSLGMKEDIRIWLLFLYNFNGQTIFSDLLWTPDNQLELFTDAAGSKELGCGAYFQGSWVYFKWPDFWNNETMRDITFLEVVPILLAFLTWDSKLKGKKVILRSDNLSVVDIINKKSSRNSRVMYLIRHLMLALLLNNVQIKARHISGKKNQISDAISRFQWSTLWNFLPEGASRTPSPIPESFLQLFNQK
jgi:hypothetical protein